MKRMRGSALLALALVAALGVLSCSKTNNHGAASNVYQSGCLEGVDQTNGWDETLTLDWNGQDLRLVHTNVCWNCGFKILVSQSVDAGVLDVQEADSGHAELDPGRGLPVPDADRRRHGSHLRQDDQSSGGRQHEALRLHPSQRRDLPLKKRNPASGNVIDRTRTILR